MHRRDNAAFGRNQTGRSPDRDSPTSETPNPKCQNPNKSQKDKFQEVTGETATRSPSVGLDVSYGTRLPLADVEGPRGQDALATRGRDARVTVASRLEPVEGVILAAGQQGLVDVPELGKVHGVEIIFRQVHGEAPVVGRNRPDEAGSGHRPDIVGVVLCVHGYPSAAGVE